MGTDGGDWAGLRQIESELDSLNTHISVFRPKVDPAFLGTAWMEAD